MTLRLGLLVDSTTVPAWIAHLARRLAALDGARVAAISSADLPPAPRTLLDSFLALDERLQRGASGLFVPSDLKAALPDVPVISAEDINSQQFDILIDFCNLSLRAQRSNPRLGTWTWNSLAPSTGFRAVLNRAPLMTCQLISRHPSGEDSLLREAVFATDWISVTRNRNHFFIKAAATLLWALKKLILEGEEKFFSRPPVSAAVALPLASSPTAGRTIEAGAKVSESEAKIEIGEIAALAIKQATRKLEKFTRPRETWLLLAGKRAGGLVPEWAESHPIVPPRDVYWADPMAVERDGCIHLFVEEYVREIRRGRIVCLTLDEDGRVASHQVALERPYHLSYPFIFEHKNETYMIPETASRRAVELYRCARWPDRWEFVRALMSDTYAVDTTLLEHGGRWWLFTNLKTEAGASSWDELHLFFADDPLSTNWTPHPLNPVISDVRTARPAGKIFSFDGQLYRPSQDSSLRYGCALNLNRIETLTERDYAETRLETIQPPRGLLTTHTYARAGDWVFIDGATRDVNQFTADKQDKH